MPETVTETYYGDTGQRRRLTKHRSGPTISFEVGGAHGHMTVSTFPDGALAEIFLRVSKQGSTLSGILDGFAISTSIGLQYGVPLATYVSKFVGMRFEPAGYTDDPEIRRAESVLDYLFRRLALDFLSPAQCAELGVTDVVEVSV